jgi:hypothetical protein
LFEILPLSYAYNVSFNAFFGGIPFVEVFFALPTRASPARIQQKSLWLSPKALMIRREDKIRTCDPLHPIQVRYRAAPLPEHFGLQK